MNEQTKSNDTQNGQPINWQSTKQTNKQTINKSTTIESGDYTDLL